MPSSFRASDSDSPTGRTANTTNTANGAHGLRGDEGELFLRYDQPLRAVVRRRVNAPPDVIEDACSAAWAILLRRQPDRGPTLLGWLIVVATREGYRMAGERSAHVALEDEGPGSNAPSPHHDPATALLAKAELAELADRLTPRQRRFVGLQAGGYNYEEIAALTGATRRTVDRQLRKAALRRKALRAVDPEPSR
jgi:DNA-directed RNA polymerase specialized sigma24 family protein